MVVVLQRIAQSPQVDAKLSCSVASLVQVLQQWEQVFLRHRALLRRLASKCQGLCHHHDELAPFNSVLTSLLHDLWERYHSEGHVQQGPWMS